MPEYERKIREVTPEWANRHAIRELKAAIQNLDKAASNATDARENRERAYTPKADVPWADLIPAEAVELIEQAQLALRDASNVLRAAQLVCQSMVTPEAQAAAERVWVLWKERMRYVELNPNARWSRKRLTGTDEWTPLLASNDPMVLRAADRPLRAPTRILPEGEDPNTGERTREGV